MMNDTYIVTREDGRTVLRHYGVLGMKWGVRRDRGNSQHARKKQARQVWRVNEAWRKAERDLDTATVASKTRAERGEDTAKLDAKRAKLTKAMERLDTLGRQKASTLTASELEKGARQASRNKYLRKAAIRGFAKGAPMGAVIGGLSGAKAGTVLGVPGSLAGAGLGAILGGALTAAPDMIRTDKARKNLARRGIYHSAP